VWTSITAGIVAQQTSNEPGGDRFTRHLDTVIDMFLSHMKRRQEEPMKSSVMAVRDIPPLDHAEAMVLAEAEYERLLAAVERLRPEDWQRPSPCEGWNVKEMLAHLLGMMRRHGDPAEAARQTAAAAERLQAVGGLRIDALTAVQVEAYAGLTPAELAAALRAAVPTALAGRGGTTPEQRAAPYDPGPPFPGRPWTVGYLLDVVHTRDPWMHRMDVAAATGTEPVLTAEHDGRIVADVVADWARLHGRPFTLVLTGPAGGAYSAGDGGERLELDAVAFCRALCGRRAGAGLLTQQVPF
jgi:uncharacterized protein (TIGR03083 family)